MLYDSSKLSLSQWTEKKVAPRRVVMRFDVNVVEVN